jgi:serine/threonine protein kinase
MKRKSVEHYQLLEKLGEGGMAEVYKAYDPHQDRYIAIKLIHSNLQACNVNLGEREP